MALLNYSTKIPAGKTAAEVQQDLAKHGAKRVMLDYGDGGEPEALTFQVLRGEESLAFKVPVRPDLVLKVLEKQYRAGQLRSHMPRPTKEHAVRVAWRIIKDWVEAQMAILETEMVTMEEVFLPYLLDSKGQTLYQVMTNSGFYLTEGKG